MDAYVEITADVITRALHAVYGRCVRAALTPAYVLRDFQRALCRIPDWADQDLDRYIPPFHLRRMRRAWVTMQLADSWRTARELLHTCCIASARALYPQPQLFFQGDDEAVRRIVGHECLLILGCRAQPPLAGADAGDQHVPSMAASADDAAPLPADDDEPTDNDDDDQDAGEPDDGVDDADADADDIGSDDDQVDMESEEPADAEEESDDEPAEDETANEVGGAAAADVDDMGRADVDVDDMGRADVDMIEGDACVDERMAIDAPAAVQNERKHRSRSIEKLIREKRLKRMKLASKHPLSDRFF